MLTIKLIGIGLYMPVNLHKLAKKLNKLQKSFLFIASDSYIDIQERLKPKYSGIFYDSYDILNFAKSINKDDKVSDLFLCIGAVNIIHSDNMLSEKEINPDDEWFGVWQNEHCPLTKEFNNYGIISLTQWIKNFQESSYRSNQQYICHMITAFLGDIIYEGKLTHTDFRWCVFDFNDDMFSISESIKKCNISKGVRETILNNSPAYSTLTSEEIFKSFNSITKYVRRPGILSVFRYLNESAVTQFFIIGILLANSLNPILDFINGSILSSILMGLIFFIIIFYLRFKPSGRLG